MTLSEAQDIVSQAGKDLYFDYVRGRLIKTNIGDHYLDGQLYERDNGPDSLLDALTGPYL